MSLFREAALDGTSEQMQILMAVDAENSGAAEILKKPSTAGVICYPRDLRPLCEPRGDECAEQPAFPSPSPSQRRQQFRPTQSYEYVTAYAVIARRRDAGRMALLLLFLMLLLIFPLRPPLFALPYLTLRDKQRE